MLNSSRDEKEGAYRSGEGVEKSLLRDPGSELRPGKEKEKVQSAKTIDGMRKNKQTTSCRLATSWLGF